MNYEEIEDYDEIKKILKNRRDEDFDKFIQVNDVEVVKLVLRYGRRKDALYVLDNRDKFYGTYDYFLDLLPIIFSFNICNTHIIYHFKNDKNPEVAQYVRNIFTVSEERLRKELIGNNVNIITMSESGADWDCNEKIIQKEIKE